LPIYKKGRLPACSCNTPGALMFGRYQNEKDNLLSKFVHFHFKIVPEFLFFLGTVIVSIVASYLKAFFYGSEQKPTQSPKQKKEK
jgi:hypothetical protein